VSKPFLDGRFPEQQVVIENDLCVFVQMPQPVPNGSGLIIPRTSRATLFDLTPEEWAATYNLLRGVKAYLDKTLEPDGYNVGWNVGPVSAQPVPHVHLHVIARFRDEPPAGRGVRDQLQQSENKRP
jgi:diadenosine tetraphosphate (Ap4A) HIT family hydrolase